MTWTPAVALLAACMAIPAPALAGRAASKANAQQEALVRRTAESAKAGNYAAGLIAARAELAYAESHFGEHGVSTAQALCELVELELLSGEFSEARKDDGRAIAITEAKGHGADELLATALTGFAGVLAHLGDYAGAEIRYRRALEPREAPLVIDPVQHATTLCGLASTLSAQGQLSEAEADFKLALSEMEAGAGREHAFVATVLDNLAALYLGQRQFALAEPLFRRAMAIREKALGPNRPIVASSLVNLGALHALRGDYDEAESLYLRALAIYESAFGTDNPRIANCLENLAFLYKARGESDKQAKAAARAATIRARQ